MNLWLNLPVQNIYLALYLLNILSFLGYGTSCLATTSMVKEFERYGIPELRNPTGILQILSSMILLCGFLEPWLVVFGSLQLIVMMATGVAVRHRVGDGLFKMSPALLYLLLNAYIVVAHLFFDASLPEIY